MFLPACLPGELLTSTGFSHSTEKNLITPVFATFFYIRITETDPLMGVFVLQITCLGFIFPFLSQYLWHPDVFNPAKHIKLEANTFKLLIC